MKTTILKSRWLIMIGSIIIGGGIFFWLSNNVNQPVPPTTPTKPSSTQETIEVTTKPASLESPVSPVSPLSPVMNGSPSPEVDPEKIQAMVDQALQAQQQKDYARAIELVNKILAEDPANFIAFNLRGSAFMEMGETDKALADYTKAIEVEPLFPHSLYNRGRLLRLQGQYSEALTDLQKVADLSPAEFGYRANGNIGLIYYAQQEYDQALAAFEKSIAANMENRADVYFFRGETYLAMANWEAAIQDYQAAIERFPNYAEAYRGLGYAYLRAGQLDQAKQALSRSLELTPDYPEAYLYLSVTQLADEQIDEAEVSMRQAVSKLDSLSLAQRQLAVNRVTEALQMFATENPDQSAQADRLLELLP